ncbi:MAG: YaiI/YqxD family protein [Nitrospinota bacterium]|nr:YaiI/YqxD family protein [Nitrospinota bacterium]
MRIWVDADACPRVVKEFIFRASERLKVHVVFVTNSPIYLPPSNHLEIIYVPKDPDAADQYIIQNLGKEDLVITADIPMASEVLKKKAFVINPRGDEFTEKNIGEKVSTRNLMSDLRSSGMMGGGPPPMNSKDTQKFSSAFDRIVTKLLQT